MKINRFFNMSRLKKKNLINSMLKRTETIYNKNFIRNVTENFIYKSNTFVYGKEFTFLSNDFYNLEAAKHVITHLDLNYYDNCIFLDYNKDSIQELFNDSYNNKKNHYNMTINDDNIEIENLFIRKEFEKFFVKHIPFQNKYFKIFNDSIVIKNNPGMLMNLVDSNLTIAYNTLLQPFTKIIAGLPPLNLLWEDIILNIDKKFIQNHLKDSFDNYINNINEYEEPPIFNDTFLKEKFYKESYNDSLYLTHVIYACSLLKLLADTNQRVLVVGKESMLKSIEKMCQSNKNIPNIKYIYRSYLLSNEDLNKLENNSNTLNMKIKRMVKKNKENFSLEFIEKLFKNIEIPEYHNFSKNNYENFKGKEYYEVLVEKLAMLSYLIDNRFIKYWAYGNNNFLESLVIFKKLNINIDFENLINNYFKVEEKYRKVFNLIHNKEIDKLLFYPGGGRLNKDMKPIIKERYEDEKIKTQFYIGTIQNLKQLDILQLTYYKKVQELIIKTLEETKNQDEIIAMKNWENGILTQSTIITIKNLLYKANIELGLIKFPNFLKKDFKTILYDKIQLINSKMKNKLMHEKNININSQLDEVKLINQYCQEKYVEIDLENEEYRILKDTKEGNYKPLLIKNLKNDNISFQSSQVFNENDLNKMRDKGAIEHDFNFDINQNGEVIPKDEKFKNNPIVKDIFEKCKINDKDIHNIMENMKNTVNIDEFNKFE